MSEDIVEAIEIAQKLRSHLPPPETAEAPWNAGFVPVPTEQLRMLLDGFDRLYLTNSSKSAAVKVSRTEAENLSWILDELFRRCRITIFPDSPIGYPIQHDPYWGENRRTMIEAMIIRNI